VLVIEFELDIVNVHVVGPVDVLGFVRRAEDGPEGLRHPEEPREQLLHHGRQR